MPKILIAFSEAKPKDRKAATSSMNMKKLIKQRMEKDSEDNTYTVLTINEKMKLATVVTLINTPLKKLRKADGVVAVETYTVNGSKCRIEKAKKDKKE